MTLSPEENARRLADPARIGGAKLIDVDLLANIRRAATLFLPEGAVTIDVTDMSAEQAATEILAKV